MNLSLILEDIPETREMLMQVAVAAFPNIQAESAADVASALAAINRADFDLALLDLGLPDGDGVDVVAALARKSPQCMIVVVSIYGDDEHLFPALRAGAHGYMLKEQPQELLVRQLRGISEGQPPLSPAIARRLLSHFQTVPESSIDGAQLTPRERAVLILLAKGIRVAEIADSMSISRHTVGDHVKNIYRKLNISSRAEATLRAINMGLV